MRDRVKLEDAKGFVKDSFSKSVLNTDNAGLSQYKARRAQVLKEQEAFDQLKEQNKDLKELVVDMLSFSFNTANLSNDKLVEMETKLRKHLNG